jgi:hypothetical protein
LKTFLVSFASCVADFALWLSEDILDTSHLPSFFLDADGMQVRDGRVVCFGRLKTLVVCFEFCVPEFALWLAVDRRHTSHPPSFFLASDVMQVLDTILSVSSMSLDH